MTITLSSGTERLTRANIDPMLIRFCVELTPKPVAASHLWFALLSHKMKR